MAQDSWPSPAHNSRAVTDTEYEKIAAHFSDNGVYGSPSSAAAVTAGVGLTVTVRASVSASVRGHAWTSGTSAVTLNVDANTSGSPRTDWVVLRLDRSDWSVTAVIRKGTPGAGAPALVQDVDDTGLYEVPLALVAIAPGSGSVTVTRAELYVGSRIRPGTSTTRNPRPAPGELCFETDTGRMRMWTGVLWLTVADTSGEIVVNSPLAAWRWDADSVLTKRNGVVHLRLGSFERIGGTLAAPDDSRLPVLIPDAYRHPLRDQYGIVYCTGVAVARLTVYSRASDRAGQVWLVAHPSIAHGDYIVPGSGMSWVVD